MTEPSDITAPKDPAEYRPRPLLGVTFWAMIAFAVICVLAGVAIAQFGPRLFAPKPAPHAAETAPSAEPPPPPDDPMLRRMVGSVIPREATEWQRRSIESPGGGSCGNGRSIARLCAIGAQGGELDGVRYLSKSLVDGASSMQAEGVDPLFGAIRWGLGFALDGEGYPGPTPTCFHWGGAGGSFGLMDQPTGVSCGYAMNNMIMGGAEPRNEPRNNRLWSALKQVMSGL